MPRKFGSPTRALTMMTMVAVIIDGEDVVKTPKDDA